MGNRIRTTDVEIWAALARVSQEAEAPAVAEVKYLRAAQLLRLVMKSGQRVAILREKIQVLATAAAAKVADVRIENFGMALHWPQLDLD